MPPKPVPKKIDITQIKVPVWAKPNKGIWVEILDDAGIIPLDYKKARIESIKEEEKKAVVNYEGADTGEKEVYCDRILERSEEPQVLEDLVDAERKEQEQQEEETADATKQLLE